MHPLRAKSVFFHDIFLREFGASDRRMNSFIEKLQRPIENEARQKNAVIGCKVPCSMQCGDNSFCRYKPEERIHSRLEPVGYIVQILGRHKIVDLAKRTKIQERNWEGREDNLPNAMRIDRIVRL